MVASAPADSAPADARASPPHRADDVAETLQGLAAGPRDIAAPVQLFDDALGGVYFPGEGDAVSPPRVAASAHKRSAPPRDPSTPSTKTPNAKRGKVTAANGSPRRSVLRAAASILSTMQHADPTPTSVAGPPAIRRTGPSPASALAPFPDPPPRVPTKKLTKSVGANKKKIGHIPKSGFINDLRKLRFKQKGESFTPPQIAKDLRDRRRMMLYHFSKAGKVATKQRTNQTITEGGRVTRSQVDDLQDWVVDLDAAEGKTDDVRRLDRYCFEQLVPLPLRSNLLILVNIADDKKLLKGRWGKSTSNKSSTHEPLGESSTSS